MGVEGKPIINLRQLLMDSLVKAGLIRNGSHLTERDMERDRTERPETWANMQTGSKVF